MNHRRTLPAWLAILAMVLHGLWPLLAQAKPHVPVLSFAVCTAGGVAYHLELPADDSPLERGASTLHGHCAFCTFGAGAPVLPPAAGVPLACAAPASACCVSQADSGFPSSLSCPPAQPRAPPLAS